MVSTRTLRTGLGLAFGALLSAGFLGACGGGSDTASTNQWATDVCTSLASFVENLQQQSTALQSTAEQDPNDLGATKAELVSFTDGGLTSTEALIEKVDGIGAPDLEDGEAIADGLHDSLEDVKKGFSDAKSQAEALPIDNPAAFVQGVQDLSSQLQEAGEKSVGTLNNLRDKYPQMAKALNDEPVCQQVNPG